MTIRRYSKLKIMSPNISARSLNLMSFRGLVCLAFWSFGGVADVGTAEKVNSSLATLFR